VDLSVQLAPRNSRGLLLANPVMTASGTFGYGMEYSDLVDIQRLGAIVCKGTTLEPREGNVQPRITETSSGVLNSIGLQNIGVQALIAEKAPIWATWKIPVIVNIAGNTLEEYGLIAERLNNVKGISGLEINISCPNVKCGGMEFGLEPESAAQVTAAVKKATTLPVIVKLSPNTNRVVDIAAAVAAAGADALTLINTLKGMAIDIYTRKPVLGNVTGGLSGPAIKPVALRMVYDIAGTVRIPIIGSGGIFSGSDAIEFIMAGAAAVQAGSASFANPRASLDILDGISAYMQRENINKIADLVGIARK
jgi:dihydroorotate dehydrogenase (NAD+) catalytic subunit